MQGYNVLHPMGWDSFGLPAEQYAIKTGNHPDKFTKQNNFLLTTKRLHTQYNLLYILNHTRYTPTTKYIINQIIIHTNPQFHN